MKVKKIYPTISVVNVPPVEFGGIRHYTYAIAAFNLRIGIIPFVQDDLLFWKTSSLIGKPLQFATIDEAMHYVVQKMTKVVEESEQ